jgi:hypothetical protein
LAISVEEAMSAYGFVFQLANSVPELKGTLDQAIQGGWTPQKLTATIESSNWWRNNSDTARALVNAQATDPSTYNQNLANATQLIKLKAFQLGRTMDDGLANQLALRTLTENASWDDQRLTMLVSDSTKVGRGDSGAYGGQAANIAGHMQQLAENYGVAYTGQWMDLWIGLVQSGRESLDSWESVMKARAKAAYPQFATQIDSGMTVRDIADPYVSTYAQILEVPETQVTLKDPMIKKALQQTGEDGTTRTSMPLWQFEQQLKNDPRYDNTKQAKSDAFDMLDTIGRDWGFVGGGQ